MRKFILAASLLAAAAPLPAAAPATAPALGDAATRKDVQCFVLFVSVVGNAKDEGAAKSAMVGVSYYLGKITRAAPTIDLVALVKQESKSLQGANPQQVGAACEQEYNKRMTDVDNLGKALSAGK